MPRQGSHKSYLDAIYAIPLITSPEVFGLHENATITKDLKETDEMLGSLMLTQSSRAAGGEFATQCPHPKALMSEDASAEDAARA